MRDPFEMAEIKQISARIPLELYRRIKVKAAQTGKTMNEIIKESLQEWLKEQDDEQHG